jgi:hypothetical protein
MRRAVQLLLVLAFLGCGGYLMYSGRVWVGVLAVLFSLAGLAGLAVDRAGRRGPGRLTGPYLLLAAGIAAAGAVLGLGLIIATPAMESHVAARTPASTKIFGAVVLVACLAGVALFVRRWLAGRQGRKARLEEPSAEQPVERPG